MPLHRRVFLQLSGAAGLTAPFPRQITVHRPRLAPADRRELQSRMRMRLSADAAGRIAYSSRANAVKGLVPLGAKT